MIETYYRTNEFTFVKHNYFTKLNSISYEVF